MGKEEKSARGSLYLIYHSSCYLSFCNCSMGGRVRGEEPRRRCSAHLMPYLLPSVCAPVHSELDSERKNSRPAFQRQWLTNQKECCIMKLGKLPTAGDAGCLT